MSVRQVQHFELQADIYHKFRIFCKLNACCGFLPKQRISDCPFRIARLHLGARRLSEAELNGAPIGSPTSVPRTYSDRLSSVVYE
jgi:hypothetical protein